MRKLSNFKASIGRFRELINAEMEPAAGVWGTKVPLGAHKASAAVMGVILVTFVAVATAQGELHALLHLFAFVLCVIATAGPGQILARVMDKELDSTPSNGAFFGWGLASALVGIAAGHFTLYTFSLFHSLDDKHFFALTYVPEFVMVIAIPYSYWRLFYVRQWQYRLDTEKLKREAAEHGQALAQAQLKMLQAQIEPHFLFNTLASVQHLVRKDAQLADFLLSQLINYLRRAVPDTRGMGSTLGREFGLVEAYLNIVRIRLDGRLEVKVSIPSELADISFPVLIVQTLVENAIKHGIEPKQGPVCIQVAASEAVVDGSRFIDVSVTDDGVGFGAAETMGTGVGLRNIRERLVGLYGSVARLFITEAQPSGVCATVRIPRSNS